MRLRGPELLTIAVILIAAICAAIYATGPHGPHTDPIPTVDTSTSRD